MRRCLVKGSAAADLEADDVVANHVNPEELAVKFTDDARGRFVDGMEPCVADVVVVAGQEVPRFLWMNGCAGAIAENTVVECWPWVATVRPCVTSGNMMLL